MSRMKHLLWLAVAVLAVVLLAQACDGDDGTATPTPPRESPTVAPSPPSALCPIIDGQVVQGVVAVLDLKDTTFAAGEPVEMTMKLINCANSAVKRVYSTEQRYDFSVRVADGDEVWRWSDGKTFSDQQSEVTLESGQEVTTVETWDQVSGDGQPVAPGSYEITAGSTGCDESLQNCEALATKVIEITAP